MVIDCNERQYLLKILELAETVLAVNENSTVGEELKAAVTFQMIRDHSFAALLRLNYPTRDLFLDSETTLTVIDTGSISCACRLEEMESVTDENERNQWIKDRNDRQRAADAQREVSMEESRERAEIVNAVRLLEKQSEDGSSQEDLDSSGYEADVLSKDPVDTEQEEHFEEASSDSYEAEKQQNDEEEYWESDLGEDFQESPDPKEDHQEIEPDETDMVSTEEEEISGDFAESDLQTEQEESFAEEDSFEESADFEEEGYEEESENLPSNDSAENMEQEESPEDAPSDSQDNDQKSAYSSQERDIRPGTSVSDETLLEIENPYAEGCWEFPYKMPLDQMTFHYVETVVNGPGERHSCCFIVAPLSMKDNNATVLVYGEFEDGSEEKVMVGSEVPMTLNGISYMVSGLVENGVFVSSVTITSQRIQDGFSITETYRKVYEGAGGHVGIAEGAPGNHIEIHALPLYQNNEKDGEAEFLYYILRDDGKPSAGVRHMGDLIPFIWGGEKMILTGRWNEEQGYFAIEGKFEENYA